MDYDGAAVHTNLLMNEAPIPYLRNLLVESHLYSADPTEMQSSAYEHLSREVTHIRNALAEQLGKPGWCPPLTRDRIAASDDPRQSILASIRSLPASFSPERAADFDRLDEAQFFVMAAVIFGQLCGIHCVWPFEMAGKTDLAGYFSNLAKVAILADDPIVDFRSEGGEVVNGSVDEGYSEE